MSVPLGTFNTNRKASVERGVRGKGGELTSQPELGIEISG